VKRRQPALTVDGIVVFGNKILLVKRKNPPFRGSYALPGGFVEYGETVEKAAIREVLEETGLVTRMDRMLGVYSAPGRDPRGHTVSVVFRLKVVGGKLRAGDDAAEVGMVLVKDLKKLKLAFDHGKILEDAGLL
jgi:8-oxo-dGTP diphosphatase